MILLARGVQRDDTFSLIQTIAWMSIYFGGIVLDLLYTDAIKTNGNWTQSIYTIWASIVSDSQQKITGRSLHL